MASGIISEGILIIASVIVAGLITGIVISKVGTFEGYYTATTEAQKEKMLSKFEIIHVSQLNNTSVNIWIKNTGLTPIPKLDSFDVYAGAWVDFFEADGTTPTAEYDLFVEEMSTFN